MRIPTARSLVAIPLTLALLTSILAGSAAAGWRSEGPFLGSISDLAVDPTQPDTVYAATSGGGVWRSDDFGRSWTLPGGDLTGFRVEWVEVDPATPSTLWAGIDDPGNPALWRSLDRGATWKRITDRYKGEAGIVQPTGRRIAFATPRPGKPSEVWVPSTNLHYRSRDGGRTWSDFRVPGQDAYAVAVDPRDPNVVYAGGRGEKWDLSKSTDGGKSWAPAGRGLSGSVKVLLVDPKTPSTLYAVTGFNNLFRSDDGGETFTQLEGPAQATQDVWRLQLDPAYPEVLWASSEAGLFRSNDGGRHWTRSETGTGRYLARAVAFDPRDTRRMLAGCAGDGVYASDDAGAHWAPSRAGLAAGWLKRLYGSAGSPVLFAQTAVGLWRRDGRGGWSELQAPFDEEGDEVELDGVAFDRRSPQTVWAFATSRAWRSGDGGGRWEELKVKQPSLRNMMKGNLDTAQFKSLVLDPGDPKVIYAGSWSNDAPGSAVFKTVDAGKSWKPAGQGISGDTVTLLRSEAPGVVFALVEDQKLFRTGDSGGSWAAVGSGLPDGKLRDLAIDPSRPSRHYAATETGIYRSTDDGKSWAKAGGEAGKADAEAVVVGADGRVYAGVFGGVLASTDGGDSWKAMNDGLLNTDVRALAIGGPGPVRLYAGLAGGSVWSIELP